MTTKAILLVILLTVIAPPAISLEDESPRTQPAWGIVPFPIISYTPETELFGGIILSLHYDPNTEAEDDRSSYIRLRGLYSQLGQWRLSAKTDWFFEDRYNLSLSTKILNFPSKFYGLGPNTELSDEEEYNPLEFELTAGFRGQMFFPDLFLGPLVTFSRFDIEDVEEGGILDSGKLLGSDHATLVGFGPHLTWDTRDDAVYPISGFRLDSKLVIYRKELGSTGDFGRLTLDYRHFFQLHGLHVLGLQFLTDVAVAETPFEAAPRLGGSDLMRGYNEGRFVDDVYFAIQLEYRFPLIWRFGGVLFFSAGQVAPKLREFSFVNTKYAGGLGLRFSFLENPRVNLRLDFGLSPEGLAIYANVQEAF